MWADADTDNTGKLRRAEFITFASKDPTVCQLLSDFEKKHCTPEAFKAAEEAAQVSSIFVRGLTCFFRLWLLLLPRALAFLIGQMAKVT
jgi:hypothetical protein